MTGHIGSAVQTKGQECGLQCLWEYAGRSKFAFVDKKAESSV